MFFTFTLNLSIYFRGCVSSAIHLMPSTFKNVVVKFKMLCNLRNIKLKLNHYYASRTFFYWQKKLQIKFPVEERNYN